MSRFVEHASTDELAFVSRVMVPLSWRAVIELDDLEVVSCQADGNPSREFSRFLWRAGPVYCLDATASKKKSI
jgi:hypothetical protein